MRSRQQLGDAGRELGDAGTGDRRAEEGRAHPRGSGLFAELAPKLRRRQWSRPTEVGGEELVALPREQLGQAGPELRVLVAVRREGRRARTEAMRVAERDRDHLESFCDGLEHGVGICTWAVGLVDEQDRRDAQSLQGTHQDAGLGLHPLDSGDDEHGPVEHIERALDLRDEVGVPRRVDQVDGEIADVKGDDCGLDRDPALALELQRVGLRRARVHGADDVDDAGSMEQALCERGLTGVDVRQDPQVEHSIRQASYPPNRSCGPSRWTCTLGAFDAPLGSRAGDEIVRRHDRIPGPPRRVSRPTIHRGPPAVFGARRAGGG